MPRTRTDSESGYGTEPPGTPSSFNSALGDSRSVATDEQSFFFKDEEQPDDDPSKAIYPDQEHVAGEDAEVDDAPLDDTNIGPYLSEYLHLLNRSLTPYAAHPLPPDFSRAPSNRERQIYDSAIEKAGMDIWSYRVAVKQLELVLGELEGKKMETEKRRDEYRSFLSVVRRVPDEVLYAIFVRFVEECKGSPWVLTAVCRGWRRSAIEAKRIWSRISIDTTWKKKRRYADGREVCRTPKELTRHLNRSGLAPLDITIVNCDNIQLAKQLNAVRGRWENFEYYDSAAREVASALFDLKKTEGGGATVKELVVRSGGNRTKPEEIGKGETVPELMMEWMKNTKPSTIKFLQHDLRNYAKAEWWKDLHCLHIHLPAYRQGAANQEIDTEAYGKNLQTVTKILDTTKNQLTTLSLVDVQFKLSNFVTLETYTNKETGASHLLEKMNHKTFPRVKDLTLLRVKYWWDLRAPKVTDLVLECAYGQNYGPPEDMKWDLPDLVSMEYKPDGEWEYHGFISARKLETLTIKATRGHAPKTARAVWMGRENPERDVVLVPRILQFKHLFTEWQCILKGLRYLSCVTELHFYASAPAPSFFKTLLVGAKNSKIRYLPNLKVLNINLTMPQGLAHDTAKLNYTVVFQKVAEARSKGRMKLNFFEVTWSDKFGGEQNTTDFLKEHVPEKDIHKKILVTRMRTYGIDTSDGEPDESDTDTDSHSHY